MRIVLPLIIVMFGSASCDDPEPLFPVDYEASYVEVRNCRFSADHDLSPIRVLADPEGAPAYTNRDAPFPAGAVILKEEYGFDDTACTGPIQRWSVIMREPEDSSPSTIDWHWQRVDANRKVFESLGCVVQDDEPDFAGVDQAFQALRFAANHPGTTKNAVALYDVAGLRILKIHRLHSASIRERDDQD